MEKKKLQVIFGLIIVLFVAVTVFLVKYFEIKQDAVYKDYLSKIASVENEKNVQIISLSQKLLQKEKENEGLKSILADTRNDLEILGKKLVQPALATATTSEPNTANGSTAATK